LSVRLEDVLLRLLTETDGPYVKIGRDPARPWDVKLIENYLSQIWAVQPEEVRKRIWFNFRQILQTLGLVKIL
ncbi:MAG: TatD family hydrolase, partial [Syntrophales bacterium]|nr:TatD family hydrolase [Syntrophales bacterium]